MDTNSEDCDQTPMELVLKRSLMSKNKLAIIQQTEEGKRYSCIQCFATYSEKEKLEVHLCSHFKEYRFLCGICGTGLKRKEHLDRHTLGHQEVRPHVCQVCGKGFKRKEHLNIHSAIHSGDKSQICPLCHRSFYRKDHLQKHLQTHSKMFMEQNIHPLSDQELMEIKQEVYDDEDARGSGDDSMQCDTTLEIDEENQSAHQNGFTPKDPMRPFECVVCNKTYKRKDHLKLHSLTHLKKDKICSECGKAFHKEEQLLIHMNVHLNQYPQVKQEHDQPSEVDGLIDNSDIDIMPMDSSELLVPRYEVHNRQSGAGERRPHECPVCQRRFKRKQHLKVHANVHMKHHTIWCSRCNEGFLSNDQFESHQCPDRGSSAEYEQMTSAPPDARKENNHPIEFVPIPIVSCLPTPAVDEAALPAPVRVYVCKYCQKPFKRKDHYKIHLHIHTGVKTFFCPDCGKGFYRKDHLQKHLQVHQKPALPRPAPSKPRKALPDLFPINMLPNQHKPQSSVKPEITITAPSNTKLRVPLQIKVPYQMVTSLDNGEQRAITVEPQAS